MYRDMVAAGTVDNDIILSALDRTGLLLFSSGQGPFYQTGLGLIRDVKANNKQLYDNLAVVPAPVGASGVVGKGLIMTSEGKAAKARSAQCGNGPTVIAGSIKVDGMLGPFAAHFQLAPVPQIAGHLTGGENACDLVEGQLRQWVVRVHVNTWGILSPRARVPAASDADIERTIAGKPLEGLDLGLPRVVRHRREKGDSRLNAVDPGRRAP